MGHAPPWPEALAKERLRRLERGIEPVLVAWEGQPFAPQFWVPEAHRDADAHCTIRFEDGTDHRWTVGLANQLELDRAALDGRVFVATTLPLVQPVPRGYHHVEVRVGDRAYAAHLICAPVKAYLPRAMPRAWGAFAPLYALRGDLDWGVGDYGALGEFAAWIGELGGAFVGTLPLLPLFLDEPFDPSPYAAISRLYWNELFIGPSAAPEFNSGRVQRFLARSRNASAARRRRTQRNVDYRSVHAFKRSLLEEMFAALSEDAERERQFRDYLTDDQEVLAYAEFRARQERDGPWREWTPKQRARNPEPQEIRLHAYTQWLAAGQLEAAADRARRAGLGLYLDFPLGVHTEGYDAWAHPQSFIDGLSVGAPPDRYFSRGQDWGFAPLHPRGARADGYTYFRRSVAHHCRAAGVLRVDHVMGLHRLFVIPRGFPASEGLYLHLPAQDLYAILCLESHRHRTVLVGEDLGTVPPYVRPEMEKHNVHRMHILQAALTPESGSVLPNPPEHALASLNTHDLATFWGFWKKQDIPKRVSLGLLEKDHRLVAAKRRRETVRDAIIETLRRERLLPRKDRPDVAQVLRACLVHLARSRARLLCVTLEDLWLEKEPQNVPGTGPEHGNWSRRLRRTVGELRADRDVRAVLSEIDKNRKRPTP